MWHGVRGGSRKRRTLECGRRGRLKVVRDLHDVLLLSVSAELGQRWASKEFREMFSMNGTGPGLKRGVPVNRQRSDRKNGALFRGDNLTFFGRVPVRVTRI